MKLLSLVLLSPAFVIYLSVGHPISLWTLKKIDTYREKNILVEIPEPWDLQQPLPPAAGAPRQSVGWTPFGSASGGPERTGASASVSWLVSDGCCGTRHLSTGPEGKIGPLRLSRARLLATDVLPYSLVRASVRLLPASVHRPPED